MSAPNGRRVLLAVAAVAVPALARAHLVNSGLGPFYDGASHVVLTPQDALSALAIALLAGRCGAATGRATLFALSAAWLVGGLAGLASPTPSSAEWPGAVSLLALGGMVAAEARVSTAVMVGLGIGCGVVHGYLNGSAMDQARLGAPGLAGAVATVFVLVTLGGALAASVRAAWARVAVRVAGSWVTAIGLLALGWSLRRG